MRRRYKDESDEVGLSLTPSRPPPPAQRLLVEPLIIPSLSIISISDSGRGERAKHEHRLLGELNGSGVFLNTMTSQTILATILAL